METFLNVDNQPSILRIDTSTEHKDLNIPSFLDVIREVTHDDNYHSSHMASANHKMPEQDKVAIKERISKKKGSSSSKN